MAGSPDPPCTPRRAQSHAHVGIVGSTESKSQGLCVSTISASYSVLRGLQIHAQTVGIVGSGSKMLPLTVQNEVQSRGVSENLSMGILQKEHFV